MFCPNCGNQLEDGSRFCPACGKPVVSEGTQQDAPNASGSTQNQYTQHAHTQYVHKDYLAHLVLPWTQPRVTFKPPLDWNERNLSPILGSNQQYYLDQFEWCAAKKQQQSQSPGTLSDHLPRFLSQYVEGNPAISVDSHCRIRSLGASLRCFSPLRQLRYFSFNDPGQYRSRCMVLDLVPAIRQRFQSAVHGTCLQKGCSQ